MLNITDFNVLQKLSSVLRLVSPPRISFDTIVSKKNCMKNLSKAVSFPGIKYDAHKDFRWSIVIFRLEKSNLSYSQSKPRKKVHCISGALVQ